MAFEVRIVSRITDEPPDAWNVLAGQRPFASYRWYQFGERVLARDIPYYVTLIDQGEPVARATFWLMRQEMLPDFPAPARRLIEAMLRRWPLFTCRVPLASAPGLILPADPAQRRAALATISDTARELSRQFHSSFIVFDYMQDSYSDWPGPFRRFDSMDPGTQLAIRWPDFDSYIKQLGKSARKDYHRHTNRAADQAIEVKAQPTITRVDEAMGLIRNVEKHHGTTPNPYLNALVQHAGEIDYTWLTAEIGDRLVGCGLLIGDSNTRLLALLGLDYEVRYVYFQLLYAAIRAAIETGTRILYGGGGAYDIKERLGFEKETNNHLIFASNYRLLNWLTRQLV